MTTRLIPDTMRGGDPTLLRDEIRHLIETGILAHPRSQQTEIGPSEIGTPCDRRLGHRLNNTPPARPAAPSWRSTVGTAVHAWLAALLQANNAATGYDRFLVEEKVDVGDIGDTAVYGSVDCYDVVTCTVLDWKIVGPTSLKKYIRYGPGQQYATQVSLYGRGRQRQGLPVDTVAIYFLPMNGEIGDGLFWHQAYNEAVATAALDRATKIREALHLVGPDIVLPLLPTADAHCTYCPWYRPNTTNLAAACPGHDQPQGRRTTP